MFEPRHSPPRQFRRKRDVLDLLVGDQHLRHPLQQPAEHLLERDHESGHRLLRHHLVLPKGQPLPQRWQQVQHLPVRHHHALRAPR